MNRTRTLRLASVTLLSVVLPELGGAPACSTERTALQCLRDGAQPGPQCARMLALFGSDNA